MLECIVHFAANFHAGHGIRCDVDGGGRRVNVDDRIRCIAPYKYSMRLRLKKKKTVTSFSRLEAEPVLSFAASRAFSLVSVFRNIAYGYDVCAVHSGIVYFGFYCWCNGHSERVIFLC